MKKILTLMSTFAFASVIVTPVLACAKQQQDNILKVISNGDSRYNGWETTLLPIGIIKPSGVPTADQKPETEQTIAKVPLTVSLAQLLAKLILDKASMTTPLWFTNDLVVGSQCYNFTIDNGTLDESTGARTWKVDAVTGRISIDITYQFGIVNDDKTFKVEQYIKKTFDIKCFYTQSDYKVYSCVADITNLAKQTINVSVDDKSKPTVDTVYTDFTQETKTAIQEAINDAIGNPFINSINIDIKGITGEKVTNPSNNKWELKVNFVISFQDSLIDMSLPSPYDDSQYQPTILQFNS